MLKPMTGSVIAVLVSLSMTGCNIYDRLGEGADAVSGLGRAFLYAGAEALLVSNWPVHSASTNQLMRTFFVKLQRSPTLSRACCFDDCTSILSAFRQRESNFASLLTTRATQRTNASSTS